MRVHNPSSPSRKLSNHSVHYLTFLSTWLQTTNPMVSMRPKPRVTDVLAADAFAQGGEAGIGGFWKGHQGPARWFSLRLCASDLEAVGFTPPKDLQKEICMLETLAQGVLLLMVASDLRHTRLALTFPSFSDNTGAESATNNLFSTHPSIARVLEQIAVVSSRLNIFLDTSHIPGTRNEEADALSRWADDAVTDPPFGFTRATRFKVSLQDF